MVIPVNLAMTGPEIRSCPSLPGSLAWMACQFSPSGPGLTGLPQSLPEGAVLMLCDQWPLGQHSHSQIARELLGCVRRLGCCGVLLDFQRPNNPQAAQLAKHLSQTLPCPVAVTAPYAQATAGPVLLPPLPCHIPLAQWVQPWKGRELWLELALSAETITLTKTGAKIAPEGFPQPKSFREESLCCHYAISLAEEQGVFTLWRTRDDLRGLLSQGDKLGVSRALGLYQELGKEL